MTAPEEPTGPVIRDNRRIDPVTGQPKRGKHAASQPALQVPAGRGAPGRATLARAVLAQAAQAPPSAACRMSPRPLRRPPSRRRRRPGRPAAEPAAAAELRAQLAERTADLQRLQAEYANYRKRVDRDRATVREQAVASALTELLPVLDAINQAHEHGELSGGFKSVADSLQAAVGKLGLVSYGQRGDAFDPKIHEALAYSDSPDVTEDTCVEIFQPGYKVGERILRPARVAVAAPGSGPDGSDDAADWSTGEDNN